MNSVVQLRCGWEGDRAVKDWKRPVVVSEIDFREIVARAPVPLIVLDRELCCVSANDAMAELCQRPVRALAGRRLVELVPEAVPVATRAFEFFASGMPVTNFEIDWREERYQLAANPVHDAANQVCGLIVTATNVTRRFQIERRLRWSRGKIADRARHDHLTGLLNRRGLDTKLRRDVRSALRQGRPLSVLFADIDWFKAYNDGLGHLAGDESLRAIASQLQHHVHAAGGEVGRYGGEEFVAILPDADSNKAQRLAEAMRFAVAGLHIKHPTSIHRWVTISLGTASLEPGKHCVAAESAHSTLLGVADTALYLAKVNGRNQIRSGCL